MPPPVTLDPKTNKTALEASRAASEGLTREVQSGPRGWGSRTMWASIGFSAACTAGLFVTGNVTAENLGMCLAPLSAWIVGEKYVDGASVKR